VFWCGQKVIQEKSLTNLQRHWASKLQIYIKADGATIGKTILHVFIKYRKKYFKNLKKPHCQNTVQIHMGASGCSAESI
jgi:NRPS condensation-like uncharacterized protein